MKVDIAFHSWDKTTPGLIELDVFSCKDFDVNVVLEFIKQFGLLSVSCMTIDRTDNMISSDCYILYRAVQLVPYRVYYPIHHVDTDPFSFDRDETSYEIVGLYTSLDDAFTEKDKLTNGKA